MGPAEEFYSRLDKNIMLAIRPNEIAFDIDGVFADTFRAFLVKAGEWYGLNMEYDSLDDYFFWKTFNIEGASLERLMHGILFEPIEIGIQPITGAVEVLTRLSAHGSLRFITARSESEPILEWIRVCLPTVAADSIHIVATGESVDKLPVLKAHGVKYFVEDRLDTCFLISETDTTPIVFDQPWNRKPHPFHVVSCWEEIASLIDWS